MKMKFAIPAMILGAGLIVSTASYGKVEYTKKEKKGCAFCHVTAKSKELNDAGKYYQEKKTLEGYKAPKS
jgi:hypothetical protein